MELLLAVLHQLLSCVLHLFASLLPFCFYFMWGFPLPQLYSGLCFCELLRFPGSNIKKIHCSFITGTLHLSVCLNITVKITCQFKSSIQYPLYFFLLFSMAAYQEISAVKYSCVAEHIVMMFILNTTFHPEMLLCIAWKARSLLQLYRQHYITT